MKAGDNPILTLIDNILAIRITLELKYLAVIESNLSTGATSWKGAGGPGSSCPTPPAITDWS